MIRKNALNIRSIHSGKPAGPGAARRPSGRAGAAPKGKESDKQTNAVRTMQQLMSKLNTDLQDEATAQGALAAITPSEGSPPEKYSSWDKIAKESQAWGSTGRGKLTPADGVWGGNTKAALVRIKQFVADANISGVMIQEGEGAKPYKEMEDGAITKMAEDNITNLGRLFSKLGMDVPSAAKGRGGSGFILDQVPQTLTHEAATAADPWPEFWGDVPVTVGDLRSFPRFFQFLQGLTYTSCAALTAGELEIVERALEQSAKRRAKRRRDEPDFDEAKDASTDVDIQKLADEILESTIWKLAVPTGLLNPDDKARQAAGLISQPDTQDAAEEAKPEAAPAKPAAKPKAEPAKPEAKPEAEPEIVDPWAEDEPVAEEGVICFYTIDDMFKWFTRRARMIHGQMSRFSREAQPHPVRGGAITSQDLRAAQAYRAAISNLWGEWVRISRDVLRKIRDPKRPIVTYKMIFEASAGGLGGPGGPGAGRRGRRGPGGGGYTIPGGDSYSDRALKGPIREFMPLNWLLASDDFSGGEAQTELESASQDGRLPDINRRTWRGSDWVSIAINNVAGDTDTEKIRNFPVWAAKVRDTIRSLYVNWENDYREQLDSQVIAKQNRQWSLWSSTIRSLIYRANSGMASALARVEGSRPDQKPYNETESARRRR